MFSGANTSKLSSSWQDDTRFLFAATVLLEGKIVASLVPLLTLSDDSLLALWHTMRHALPLLTFYLGVICLARFI